MSIQNISSFNSNLINNRQIKSNTEYDSPFLSNNSSSYKSEADEKKATDKKNIYKKGFIAGSIVTSLICIVDYTMQYFLDKEADSLFSEEKKGAKSTTKNKHIPFKWLFRKK